MSIRDIDLAKYLAEGEKRRMKKKVAVEGVAAIICMLVFIGFVIGMIALKFYLIGSLITSSVKAISGSCGKTYGVESVLSGNWFCSEENK